MPTTKSLPVEKLKLDLSNFRTVPQSNETDAIQAMVSINPDWFWALTSSLLNDGYHPTENIIILKAGAPTRPKLVVKEGNRRIASLKLAFGYVSRAQIEVPTEIESAFRELPKEWKSANQQVPCAIYEPDEADVVDTIVTLTHGKGEKAGRDIWNAVARARHNRDKSGANEPALDLLEKYLMEGQNITTQQAGRWSGDYPLTVLEEAMKRLAGRFGVASARELADLYPGGFPNRSALEQILSDVGLKNLTYEIIRDKTEDFGLVRYGLPTPSLGQTGAHAGAGSSSKAATGGQGATGQSRRPLGSRTKAVPLNDPRWVMRALRDFHPKGKNREKIVTLLLEARKLKLDRHPHAFCFLLRSMFEISAKAYCADHSSTGGPKMSKPTGEDRKLVEVLRDITNHLTKNKQDKAMLKSLHGAMVELGKSEGILSVTSMNQLVHHPRFSVDETHISTLFGNVFPLLEEMNR